MSAICLVRVIHGSRLFGTDSPDSDTDIKSVWVPSARDILLGKIDWSVFSSDSSRRNTSKDTDHEQHDLARFLKLVSGGHPTAVEMMFAPETSFVEYPHESWSSVKALAPYIISADTSRFTGFIENQAAGFGIGGERLQAVHRALDVLSDAKARHPKASVADVAADVVEAAASKHVRIDGRSDGTSLLMIAGRSVHFGNRISDALNIALAFTESFDAKARKLAAGNGRDWAAVSHAVRLAEEAIELSTRGTLTLPRPNAEILSGIKHGAVPVGTVASLIGDLLPELALAQRNSILPEHPDVAAIDDLVAEMHASQVAQAFGTDNSLNLS
ncbi:hypothetical protein G6L37_04320 [Agrobacterium rubi]|nr:hypothetical protein [Agrobacterium rubi]NTF24577.1 hypothetical protein [Agrobacterium rubi]